MSRYRCVSGGPAGLPATGRGAPALLVSCLLATALLLVPGAAGADSPPALLNYQGFLTDVDGIPVEGEWKLTFRLYDTPEGTEAFFQQLVQVTPEVGVFSALLGAVAGNPLPVEPFQDGEAWLGVEVAGLDGPVELKPRQRVVSHPYSLFSGHATTCGEAQNALSLDGKVAGDYVTLTQLPQLCIAPDDLPSMLDGLCIAPDQLEDLLSSLGYEPGSFDETKLAAWLLDNGYKPDTLDADDLAAWLPANGYTPGPGFSGKYEDLSGAPDLTAYASQTELAGYCAAPCYGDADVQQLLAAGGYNACACYNDEAVLAVLTAGAYATKADVAAAKYTDDKVLAVLAAGGYNACSCYGDSDVQQLLTAGGYKACACYNDEAVLAVLTAGGYATLADVAAGQYTDEKAVAAVEAAGFLKAGLPLEASQLPPDGLDEVSNGVVTTTFLVELDSPDTPLVNNPLSGVIESTIVVPDIGLVQALSLSVNLSHPDISEVLVQLLAPDGSKAVLHDHSGPGKADIKATWDQSSLLPAGTLSAFVGKPAQGTWKLQVKDLTVGNEGTLNTWSLDFTALSDALARVNGDLEVTGTLTVGGIAVDPGPRTYVVPGASAPPGTQAVEKYFVGTGTGTYCKKRVRPTCYCGCGTGNPAWVTSDPDCTTGTCSTNCEGAQECTPAAHPDGWYKSAPAGSFYAATGESAGCGCGPFWYRYQKVTSTATWTRVKEP